MSEGLRLGAADADDRWIGIRRHQALCVAVGVVLVGEWIFARRRPAVELVAGLAALAAALPAADGQTVGAGLWRALRYVTRSRWTTVTAVVTDGDVALWGSGGTSCRLHRLAHRGRLDLSGADVAVARELATLVESLSAAPGVQHLSIHVADDDGERVTLLATPVGVVPPSAWSVDDGAAPALLGLGDGRRQRHARERWSYVRAPDELTRVWRVRDFSAVPRHRPLLEQFSRLCPAADLSVHVEVLSGARALRVAARAAHRVASDDDVSRAAGFRRSARAARAHQRVREREVAVASGRALVRLSVFVVVRAANRSQLEAVSRAVWRRALDAGLRLERGGGRQAQWYEQQLPGGLGW